MNSKPAPRSSNTSKAAGIYTPLNYTPPAPQKVPLPAPKKMGNTQKTCTENKPNVPLWTTGDHNYCKAPQPKKSDENVHTDSFGKPIDPPKDAQGELHVFPPWMKDVHDRITEIEERERVAREIKKGNQLTIDSVKDNDDKFRYWTNLPNYKVFKALSDHLKDRSGGNLKYWHGQRTKKTKHFTELFASKPGPERKATFEEEFFMVLVKLKTGRHNIDLAHTFGFSVGYISMLVSTWVNFLNIELKFLCEMMSDTENLDTMPNVFHNFPGLEITIDCTELILQRSSNLQARKETFSNYKQRDTVKFLVGLSPNLTVNYISEAYGGRSSDNHITLESERMLSALQEKPGKKRALADKGFTVGQELRELGVELIVPKFKGRNMSQFNFEDAAYSRWVSQARIHVERIIQRIRTFHIWDATVQLSMKDIISQCFSVCAYLTNFQMPICK